jgi:hypothetical protein
MFLRALRICDPPFLNDEICYIRNALNKLAYPRYFIERALSDAKRNFYSPIPDQPRREDQKYLTLPYNPVCSNLIAPIFKTHNIKIVNKTLTSIRSKLVHTKPKHNIDDGPGVYVIPCRDCPETYVGQTGRPLVTRLKEHKSYVRHAKLGSAVFNHISTRDHNIDWDSAKTVFPSGDFKKRLIVESTLIKHLPNFNLMSGVCTIDNATKNFILSSNPDILNTLPPPT